MKSYRSKSRMALLILLLVGFVTLSIAGTVLAEITIDVWSEFSTDPRRSAIGDLVNEFNAANPDIKVVHHPYENVAYITVMRTAVAAGKLPDIFMTGGSADTALYAKAGVLFDLTDWYNDHKNLYIPGYEDNISYKGKIYALPWDGLVGNLIFYNPEIMDELGIDPDLIEYWDEYLTALGKVKTAGYIPQAFANGGVGWLGGHFFNYLSMRYVPLDDVRKLVTNEGVDYLHPGFIEAAEVFVDLKDRGYLSPGVVSDARAIARGKFVAGEAGFWQEGSWALGYLKEDAPADFEYDFMVFPKFKGAAGSQTVVTSTNGDNWSVTTSSKNKAEALKFLEFIAQAENARKYVAKTRSLSLISGALTQDNATKELLKVVEVLETHPEKFDWISNIISPEIRDGAYWPAVQGLLSGQLTPRELCEFINESYHELMPDWLK